MRLPLTAGSHTLTVGFLETAPLVGSVRLQPFIRSSADTLDWTGRPHIDRLTVTGPFDVTGPGRTASRDRVFRCRPARPTPAAERACARDILSTLVRRAYRRRRPVPISRQCWASTSRFATERAASTPVSKPRCS
jgi:hypothetical protein